MIWDAIAAVGQAVSALALLLVLVQVRHARGEMRRSVSQGRADVGRQLWMLQAANTQLSGALYRTELGMGATRLTTGSLVEQAKVSHEDARQVLAYQWAWWLYQAQVIRYADHLAPGERAQFDGSLRLIYRISRAGRHWYEANKSQLDPDAVRYVDDVLTRQV